MTIKDKENISILNYNIHPVCITLKTGGILIPPMDDEVPSSIPLSWSDIEYLNSTSLAFKSGALRFEENEQEEIYSLLKIANWKDLMTREQIKELLVNPTLDGMQKIINIKEESYFSRIRSMYVYLKNTGHSGLSIKTENIINARHKEFQERKRQSSIVLTEKNSTEQSEVSLLKRELEAMRAEMQAIKAENAKPIVKRKPKVETSATSE